MPVMQVYYELDEERAKADGKDIAICRVEQLCPFPYDLIQRELKRYPSMCSETFGLPLLVKSNENLPLCIFIPKLHLHKHP